MSEQPGTSLYNQHDKGAVFSDENVIDLQKAGDNMKPYAEVQAAREAAEVAQGVASQNHIEVQPDVLAIQRALVELGNLTKTRDNYIKKAS